MNSASRPLTDLVKSVMSEFPNLSDFVDRWGGERMVLCKRSASVSTRAQVPQGGMCTHAHTLTHCFHGQVSNGSQPGGIYIRTHICMYVCICMNVQTHKDQLVILNV